MADVHFLFLNGNNLIISHYLAYLFLELENNLATIAIIFSYQKVYFCEV
jgi:hypothetical protein